MVIFNFIDCLLGPFSLSAFLFKKVIKQKKEQKKERNKKHITKDTF